MSAIAQCWKVVTSDLYSDFPSVLSGAAEPLVPFLHYVRECTSTNDRLLYIGYQPEVYVVAGRGFGGGHMMFLGRFHSLPDEQALTVRRLASQQVPFVLIPAEMHEDFPRVFSQVWQYVNRQYVPFTSVDVNGRPLAILVQASRIAGRQAEREWPCPLSPPT